MTRRPIIVVCPKTGRADVRTHADENTGAYWLSPALESQTAWVRYHDRSPRGRHEWPSTEIARLFLSLAHPVPADAVWGPDEQSEKIENLIENVRRSGEPKSSHGPTLIASLRDIRIRLENGTIDELPQTIVVDVGDGRTVRYRKEVDQA